MFEIGRAHRIAERVVAADDEAGEIAPAARIADLRGEGGELGVGGDLGRRCHPGQLVDPPVHRGDDVVDELVGRGLGRRREVARDVDLADLVGERPAGRRHGALPAILLLRRAGKDGAVESEILLVDGVRQHRGVAVERADDQLVLQHLQRRRCDGGGDALDRARLGDDRRLHRRAEVAEIGDEIEARRIGGELRDRQLVIGLGGVTALDAGPVGARDLGLVG